MWSIWERDETRTGNSVILRSRPRFPIVLVLGLFSWAIVHGPAKLVLFPSRPFTIPLPIPPSIVSSCIGWPVIPIPTRRSSRVSAISHLNTEAVYFQFIYNRIAYFPVL